MQVALEGDEEETAEPIEVSGGMVEAAGDGVLSEPEKGPTGPGGLLTDLVPGFGLQPTVSLGHFAMKLAVFAE